MVAGPPAVVAGADLVADLVAARAVAVAAPTWTTKSRSDRSDRRIARMLTGGTGP
jgi:hypothetical protein